MPVGPGDRATTLRKVGRVAEVTLGLIVPLVFAGPAIALGLFFGFWGLVIAALHLSWGATVGALSFFLPALGGLLGLTAVAVLLFRRRNLSRPLTALCAFGLICGMATASYLLLPRHPVDRFYIGAGKIYWMALLALPTVVGLRRFVLSLKS